MSKFFLLKHDHYGEAHIIYCVPHGPDSQERALVLSRDSRKPILSSEFYDSAGVEACRGGRIEIMAESDNFEEFHGDLIRLGYRNAAARIIEELL
jgi:hypothetical protein